MPSVPVYGIEQADGTLAHPSSVAAGAEALRARMAAASPLASASAERRAAAGLIDAACGAAIAFGLDALRALSLVALIGVAVGAFFVLRVIVGTIADGATPGRFVVGTRAVGQGASRLDLLQLAGREALVLFYVATAPAWLYLLLTRVEWSWYLKVESGVSLTRGPVAQDRSTATTVATVAEIDRVRAQRALASHPAPGPTPPSGAPSERRSTPIHHLDPPTSLRRITAAIVDVSLIFGVTALLGAAVTELPFWGLVPSSRMVTGAGVRVFTDVDVQNALLVLVTVWFIVRPFAIFLFGRTLGQRLMGYRVHGPHGTRVGLGKALLRESMAWIGLVGSFWSAGRGHDWDDDGSRPPRLSHDKVADTWPLPG